MSFIHHPAFQSLVLPFVLAMMACLVLRLAGPRGVALGAAMGLVLAMVAWPGFDWPVASRAQTLPWLALGSALLAALAIAVKAPATQALAKGSALVLSVVLAIAALAMTAWAALGGSLLLAQLALMVATVAGVAALWAWRAATLSLVSMLPLLLTGIGIALCLAWLPPGAPTGTDATDDPYFEPQWK